MALDTVEGFVGDKFAAARDAFEANLASGADLGASFCATKDGEVIVDLWGGFADEAKTRPWEKDTIVNVYSTTKTMTFISALLLADRGLLDFDAPVAKYWPEFAANGKAGIKVSHLMAHSAGLSGWREPITKEDLYDWEKCVSLLAAQAPLWEPGTASGYHAITQGYLIGEVVRRITGKTIGTFFREEIAGPLGRRLLDRPAGLGRRPRRRPDPAAAGGRHRQPLAERPAEDHAEQSRRRRAGDPHPRLARRRDPGRRRHRQRPLGGAGARRSWSTAAQWAASATCRKPAAGGRWRSRSPGPTSSSACR